MMKSACISAPLLIALTVFAHSADAPAEPASPDWGGVWVGVLGSAGRIGGDGALLGVAGGYDVQFDRAVIGVDGDLSGGGIDGRRMGGRFEVEALGTIRARVGYAFERFVPFGTAGVAFASTEFARGGSRDRETHFGWTIGAGLDVRLSDRLSARAEYLYVDLDRRDFGRGGAGGYAPSGGLARFGVNYRF